ncbi:MgtC/SapB family protein [Parapedobacter koreensis]|uniref:Putative Mg2+ transporter-C (MgtC) family protein n=1 Tax=Parapedobacter koreensis TaxID=332977 RepID=A0A1H7M7R2_9SPHI|nr:MgtC/SapB family protein [Parapedobacter koreensis]SEL07234.1 putative Mg2+ transporter-C (MgtC) family protein [Parapedobacter koreensis]
MIVWTHVLIRLTLAALFGAAIGLERERKNWAAGLRTHMLVCVGAALAMMVSAYGFMDILGKDNITLDPSRVAAQVISGIGFIGAGTILFLRQGIVRGLTTAAGLWTVAAIGLAAGGGMYFAASTATALAIIILWALQPLERKFSDRFKQKSLRISTVSEAKSLQIINEIFQGEKLNISSCSVDKTDGSYLITFSFKEIDKQLLAILINELQADPNVQEINWN